MLMSLISIGIIGVAFYYIYKKYNNDKRTQQLPMAHDHFGNFTTIPNTNEKTSAEPNNKKPTNVK